MQDCLLGVNILCTSHSLPVVFTGQCWLNWAMHALNWYEDWIHTDCYQQSNWHKLSEYINEYRCWNSKINNYMSNTAVSQIFIIICTFFLHKSTFLKDHGWDNACLYISSIIVISEKGLAGKNGNFGLTLQFFARVFSTMDMSPWHERWWLRQR